MSIKYKKFMKRIHNETNDEPIKKVADEPKDFSEMTKLELDEYAKKKDIELDRRQTKTNMIKEFLTNLKGEK